MNELLIHTTWMNLKCILPGEKRKTENDIIPLILYYGKDQNKQINE